MRKQTLFITLGLIVIGLLMPARLLAQGAAPLLETPLRGCYDAATYGLGLFGRGSGVIALPKPPGPVAAAYIEWVGAEDTTPGGLTLDGASQLTINGVTVNGLLAEPLQQIADGSLVGNAGYDPHAHTSAGPKGWFAWHANIGPTGPSVIVPTRPQGPLTLNISGWTSPAQQTNGASITVIYKTGACDVETEIRFLTGINWYHRYAENHQLSELLIYPVEPEDHARVIRMVFSHAGTDHTQNSCRGGAIWMTADDGAQTMPTSPAAFDLVAIGDRDSDGVARGYGINGGVEILNDPFTSLSLPCIPSLNPTPDEPYAAGHPYPRGVADAPFRVVSMTPATGGDVGGSGEWGVLEAQILIPANARWVAFQLESEPDQNGESGSWVGGGLFLVTPTATIGDRAWEDGNGNGRQEPGEPGIAGVTVTLLDADRRVLRTTTTAGDGLYTFTDLAAGDYSLRFEPPTGFVPTSADIETGQFGDAGDSDIDPDTGETPPTSLLPREADMTWDAGFVRPATLGDYVWLDRNRDGSQNDGATGVNDIEVLLTGVGPDGAYGTADDLARTTITSQGVDGPGYYRFENLPPGLFFVTFRPPAYFAFTRLRTGGDAVDSDADPGSGRTQPVELFSGDIYLGLDAGLVALPPAVQIQKTPDAQQVAYRDDAEFTITVYNPGPQELFNVTVTDPLAPDCSAQFDELPAGATKSYRCPASSVRTDFVNVATVHAVDRFDQPVDAQDDAAVDVLPQITVQKDANPTVVPRPGGLVTFTIAVTNVVEEPLTLTSLVDDIHGDLNGRGDCALPQTLAPGAVYRCSFQVNVIPPDDAGETDTVSAWVQDDEGNQTHSEDSATVLPRPQGTAGVGDLVWYDINANGLQEPDEPGVGGVQVLLFQADGALVGQQTTDPDGFYAFHNLDSGGYFLSFVLPLNGMPYTAFSPQVMEEELANSDVNPGTVSGGPLRGRTDIFFLAEETFDPSRDAGLTAPTFLEGGEEPPVGGPMRFAVYLPAVAAE